jgi:hypothetical protein
MTDREKEKCHKLLSLFQLDSKPANEVLTEGEINIFYELVFRPHNRVQILCSTQYGKSLTVALACLIISCVQGELVAIVSPKDEKAKIIMRYYIDHLGDSPLFYSQLEKDTKLERLRMEESKDRIILKNRGGIYVLSAQSGNSQKGIEAVMGAGAKIVISDESSLIPDQIESTIFRMIAGQGKDAFYCKIGNPFYRNHFYTSWVSDNYHKIFIDYQQALNEGRYSQQFIDEAKTKPNFDILFECKFPDENRIDEQGYTRLFPDELIKSCQQVVEPFGEMRLGVDVAEGGGDSNALVVRSSNYAFIAGKFRNQNTMLVPGLVIKAGEEYNVFDQNWFIDCLGVGKGTYDRLTEQNYRPYSIKFSEKADESTVYLNLRAECYWRLFKWLSEGGCLEPDNEWLQLRAIKYRVDSSGRIQIIPKDEIRSQGLPSPDAIDALASTFARKSVINKSREQMREEKELLKQFDIFKQKRFTGIIFLQ